MSCHARRQQLDHPIYRLLNPVDKIYQRLKNKVNKKSGGCFTCKHTKTLLVRDSLLHDVANELHRYDRLKRGFGIYPI